MNKNDLIAAVAEKTGLSKGDATKAVDGVLDTIENQSQTISQRQWILKGREESQ